MGKVIKPEKRRGKEAGKCKRKMKPGEKKRKKGWKV